MMQLKVKLTLLLLYLASVSAFLPSYFSRVKKSPLFGIGEWRDLIFDFPGTGDDRRLGMEQGAPPKEVCVLPFPYAEVLLQGETKQLRLYEERCVWYLTELVVFCFILNINWFIHSFIHSFFLFCLCRV
jgi:hypothetical protein